MQLFFRRRKRNWDSRGLVPAGSGSQGNEYGAFRGGRNFRGPAQTADGGGFLPVRGIVDSAESLFPSVLLPDPAGGEETVAGHGERSAFVPRGKEPGTVRSEGVQLGPEFRSALHATETEVASRNAADEERVDQFIVIDDELDRNAEIRTRELCPRET